MIRFYRDRHEYWTDDGRVDSVTRILTKAGLIKARFYTEEARNRGSMVHTLTEEFDLTGRWSKEALQYPGWVDAYREFTGLHKPSWTHIEVGVYHPGVPYAGTCDRIGSLFGKPTVLDIKSGSPAEWHWLQLAAYREAARQVVFDIDDGTLYPPVTAEAVAVLYLKKNGKHLLKWTPCADREYKMALRALSDSLEVAHED
jgi:hypothetical protein